jgi:hypothetical protein
MHRVVDTEKTRVIVVTPNPPLDTADEESKRRPFRNQATLAMAHEIALYAFVRQGIKVGDPTPLGKACEAFFRIIEPTWGLIRCPIVLNRGRRG